MNMTSMGIVLQKLVSLKIALSQLSVCVSFFSPKILFNLYNLFNIVNKQTNISATKFLLPIHPKKASISLRISPLKMPKVKINYYGKWEVFNRYYNSLSIFIKYFFDNKKNLYK